MSLPLLLLAAGLMQQSDPASSSSKPQAEPKSQQATPPEEQNPPEEDETIKREQIHYVFNPLRAKKEIEAGDFYRKQRHDFKGAAARYLEATRWNPTSAEAFLKLGEAEEQMDEPKIAREAYQRYLDLNPDSKHTVEIKKRLEKLPPN
jgi:tetratricopeptide (TPR) repeat protein